MRISLRTRIAAFLATDLAIALAMLETVLHYPRETAHEVVDAVFDALRVS